MFDGLALGVSGGVVNGNWKVIGESRSLIHRSSGFRVCDIKVNAQRTTMPTLRTEMRRRDRGSFDIVFASCS